jgi:ribosomal-protein-alanine N-acetyltransferase
VLDDPGAQHLSAWRVEAACQADVEWIAALAEQSLPEAWSARVFRAELSSPESTLWIARPAQGRRAAPAGYLAARWILDELHIVSFAVAAACRRRGAGSALLVQALASARAGAVRVATLEVRASNVTARRFYARHGFLDGSRRPCLYPDGEDAVSMRLSLQRPFFGDVAHCRLPA